MRNWLHWTVLGVIWLSVGFMVGRNFYYQRLTRHYQRETQKNLDQMKKMLEEAGRENCG